MRERVLQLVAESIGMLGVNPNLSNLLKHNGGFMFGKLLRKYFDYDIVGEFLDTEKNGHMRKKYIRKWHLKKRQ